MTAKIAVSLPDHLVAEARAAVAEGRAPSVSAYVAQAMGEKSRRRTLAAVLDDLDAELGAPGDVVTERADRALDGLRG